MRVTEVKHVVYNNSGSGWAYYSDMAEGIRYGVDHGAKVVNLSFGGWDSATIRSACQYAWGRGSIVCISAGNDSSNLSSLAESDYMLLVGATWIEEAAGLALAGRGGLEEIVRDIHEQAMGRFQELCGPYAPVLDIKAENLLKRHIEPVFKPRP